jgi:MarR family transcriptional regulator, organic hydroperoxide resistance regulator
VAAGTSSKEDLAGEAWRPLARFFFDTARHRQRFLSELDLTPNDLRAMTVLAPSSGLTMRQLADEWVCDASNATFIVDRLEKRGLAERRSVPTDRRVKLVVLTARGRRTLERVLERFYEPPQELLQLSRDDLEAIRDAVTRFPAAPWVPATTATSG